LLTTRIEPKAYLAYQIQTTLLTISLYQLDKLSSIKPTYLIRPYTNSKTLYTFCFITKKLKCHYNFAFLNNNPIQNWNVQQIFCNEITKSFLIDHLKFAILYWIVIQKSEVVMAFQLFCNETKSVKCLGICVRSNEICRFDWTKHVKLISIK
jgi:hypothetical protein